MEKTKQVIICRTDLQMKSGKLAAQCSHGSMAFLTRGMKSQYFFPNNPNHFITSCFTEEHTKEIDHWTKNSFRKIIVSVDSEEKLVAIHEKALAAGLISHLIIDNGVTVFNNVPTKTVLAIGPHFDSKFIGITDHLPLLK